MRKTVVAAMFFCVLFIASCGNGEGGDTLYTYYKDEIAEAEYVPEEKPEVLYVPYVPYIPYAPYIEETIKPTFALTLPWQTAYANLLREYAAYATARSSHYDSNGRFILRDINNSGVPVLIILANHGIFSQTIAAYTFANNMTVPLEADFWLNNYSVSADGQGILIDAMDSGFFYYAVFAKRDGQLIQELNIISDWTCYQDGYEGCNEYFINDMPATEYEYNYLLYSVFGGGSSWLSEFTWHWPLEINEDNIHEIVYGWQHGSNVREAIRAFAAILQDELPFVYFSYRHVGHVDWLTGGELTWRPIFDEPIYMYTYLNSQPEIFTYEIVRFAIVDMDGSGTPELVLASNWDGDHLILHYKGDGVVHGFGIPSRQFQSPKADGTFLQLSWMQCWGAIARLDFSRGYAQLKMLYEWDSLLGHETYGDDGMGYLFLNGKFVDFEEGWAIVEDVREYQHNKEDVIWHPFEDVFDILAALASSYM